MIENPMNEIAMKAGPCLKCFKEIDYGEPSYFHRRYGDKWLLRTIERARKGGIDCKYGSVAVAGKDVFQGGEAYKSYFCCECQTVVDSWRREGLKAYEDGRLRREQDRLRQEQEERQRLAKRQEWFAAHPTMRLGEFKSMIAAIEGPDDALIFGPSEYGHSHWRTPSVFTAIARKVENENGDAEYYSLKPFDLSGIGLEALAAMNESLGTGIILAVVIDEERCPF